MVLYRHHIDQIQKEFFTYSHPCTNKMVVKFLDLCYCRWGPNSIFVTVTIKSKRNCRNLAWCSTDTLLTRYKRKFSLTATHVRLKEVFGFFRLLLFYLCVLSNIHQQIGHSFKPKRLFKVHNTTPLNPLFKLRILFSSWAYFMHTLRTPVRKSLLPFKKCSCIGVNYWAS